MSGDSQLLGPNAQSQPRADPGKPPLPVALVVPSADPSEKEPWAASAAVLSRQARPAKPCSGVSSEFNSLSLHSSQQCHDLPCSTSPAPLPLSEFSVASYLPEKTGRIRTEPARAPNPPSAHRGGRLKPRALPSSSRGRISCPLS